MITDIKELNFPTYATLSSATATLNDMGDKTITAQVKIDGGVAPDFSYDWEVEFKGERYIQPLREPQASKGNESICSVIDLTFYHKTIYDLKRYYFPKMAEVQSGTVSVDKYIADLNVNLEGFCDALQQVLDYYLEIGYFNERITINLKGKGTGIYAEEKQYVQIQYTHIWDVVQKIYDLFGVRWSIEGREIKIGYPTEEVAHTFEYGFEGGLLKVERQVQSADIRNSLLGRGGSKNLPYRYFKEADPQNPSFPADPDAIPELANIYFTELRGKTFRDYIKGWKAKHYGGEPMQEPTEAYTKGYTDTTFNPIEYVEDKVSIAKYGLLQGGLENQEDIYPTIQGVEVDGLGRVDEIVGAEQVTVDEPTSENPQNNSTLIGISATKVVDYGAGDISSTQTYTIRTESYKVSKGRKGVFMGWYSAKGTENIVTTKETLNPPFAPNVITQTTNKELKCEFGKYKLFNANTNAELITSVISDDMEVYAEVEVIISGFTQGYDNTHDDPWAGEVGSRMFVTERNVSITVEGGLSDTLIHGIILDNYEDGERISGLTSIVNGESSTVTIQSLEFEVPEDGATNVDVPINIIVDKSGEGLYEFEKTVKAVNVDTNEVVSSINIPQGKYYLRVSVDIRNNSTSTQTYKVELMPSYIYYPTDSEEFKPTFYIYVKNIWNTTRNEGESNEAYTNRVWTPILGDREGNEAKVVFTTGWLAGHSDYEFVISDVEYAGGKGVQSEDGIPAEWKITLIKSDAEIEATGKWIPSTTQQANVGDKFFFIGIDMPHEYTLWAEQAVDNYKADQLIETAHIKPTWVVQTDKVRLNQLQPNETEPLLEALKAGNSIRLADTRFIKGAYEKLYLQSVTYTWDAQTIMHPNVEVVLSDKVVTTTNPVAQLQGEVDALTKQVGSLSNIQQIVRAVGDKLYLRKDGFEETSNSPTKFNKLVSSRDYRQGAVGGNGWGLRSEQGKGIIEVDKLIVRDEMQVNSLVVNQVSVIGGKEILSAASITCSRVETTEQGFKCYFDQKRGSVANLFQVNDIAYSQVFNANDIEVKYYKREVIEVGDNYILLSLEGDGNGAPQEGDVIAQYGNTEDVNRQYVIIRDVIGGGYERMLSNLDSVYSSGVEYYFAGRLEGDTPRWFVGNSTQFIEYYKGELRINAKLKVGDNFQDVGDIVNTLEQDIQGVESSIQSSIENLQNQIDGVVDSYFYPYSPTTDNFPANEWTTDEEKARHIGDTFTNINEYLNPNGSVNDHDAGKSWRWCQCLDETITDYVEVEDADGNSYRLHWLPIADSDAVLALQKAAAAQKTADKKIRTFVVQPTTPYYVGDFWYDGDTRLKVCINSRATGSFNANDWKTADSLNRYGENLVKGSETPNYITGGSQYPDHNWYYYTKIWALNRQLEKGKTYTLTCQSTGDWTNKESSSANNNVNLWITNRKTYYQIISDANTATGTTFIWNQDDVDGEPQVIRLNAYGNPQSFWNLKIEEGDTATPWSLAPEEQSVVYHNSSSDEPIGVKEGDIWIPSDASHTTYTFTNGTWVISGDSTGTTINNGLITSGTIQLGDPQTVAKAGITGSGTTDKSVRIWAGNGESSKESAPFRVLQDGTLYATKANIEGRLNAGSAGTGDMIIEEGAISVNDDLDNQLMRLDGTGLSTTTENGSYNIVGYNPIGISGAAMQQIEVSADDDSIGFPVYALYIPRGKVCGLRYPIKRVSTSPYKVLKTDTVILCSGSQSSKLYLPADAEDGQMYIIIGNATSGTKVEVVAATGQTIKGYGFSVSLYTITGDYADKFIYMAQEKMWYVLKDKENV